MNKHLIILGIAVLLINVVGLSGCTQQTATEKENNNSITIENQPPIIEECKVDYFDKESSPTVYFLGYAQDPDGTITSYHWNLSDGTKSNEQFFTHTFQESGTYYATLTVTDNNGATDSKTLEITVNIQPDEDSEEEEWNPEYGVNYTVNVISVIDGDTFDAIFPDGSEERIRLLGIDTPETTASENKENEYDDISDLSCLASYGLEAKDFAETWLEGNTVMIQFDSTAGFKGYYGRWLAYVFLIDGADFGEELITNGYARVYTEGTCSKESYYVTLQNQALTDRVGLWSCIPEEEPPAEPEENDLEIIEVNALDEYVVIHNYGESSVIMTGFKLYDDSNYWKPYTFPTGFTLDTEASVTVHTFSGVDTSTDLYWGRGNHIWNNDHDTAYLYDNNYELVDSYSY